MEKRLTKRPEGQVITKARRLPADQHPCLVYLGSLSKGSRRAMAQALRVVAEMAGIRDDDWPGLRYPHVALIRTELDARYSPNTTNKILSALRGVAKQAWLLGYMSAEEYQRIKAIKNVQSSSLPAGRLVTQGEISALFAACAADSSPAGIRDAAVLGLLVGLGLRRAEVAAILLSDLQISEERWELTVRGKGRRQRLLWLVNGVRWAVEDWLALRGSGEGPLFVAIRKDGSVLSLGEDAGLSDQAIYKILSKRAEEAHVEELTPHDFRRTFVSDLLEKDVDIVTIQRLCGHASVGTTARYDRRPEEAKRKALESLHIPYQRKERG
jgi:site-specific recombinase XerD